MACSVKAGTGHTIEERKPEALPTYPARKAPFKMSMKTLDDPMFDIALSCVTLV